MFLGEEGLIGMLALVTTRDDRGHTGTDFLDWVGKRCEANADPRYIRDGIVRTWIARERQPEIARTWFLGGLVHDLLH